MSEAFSRIVLNESLEKNKLFFIPQGIRCPTCNEFINLERINKIILQGNQPCPRCLNYISRTDVGKYLAVIDGVKMEDKKETYTTGAQRSQRMLRYDLIPFLALERLAERYTGHEINGIPNGGALKYGEMNWKKGLPTSDIFNHVMVHLGKWNEKLQELKFKHGSSVPAMEIIRQEMILFSAQDDNLAAAVWGIFALMWQEHSQFYHDDRYKSGSLADERVAEVPSV